MEAYKGLELLVQAFETARPSIPDWRLIVAGSGPLPPALASGAVPEIEVINRYLPDEEVARLMRRCAVVVLPYLSATQSGVIALAWAFERPVVSTAVGGLGEMVVQGKTGILVRPGDPAALSEALRGIARSAATRARMGREIRKLAEARWAPQVVARRHLALYSEVLRAQRPR
jgi:glycosyltransferase involved in cell wall biosynthesis